MERVEKIAAKGPRGILLREKDLDAEEYVELARRVLEICRRYGTACILHSWPKAARELGCSGIHLSFGQFLKEVEEGNLLEGFGMIGVSVHSAGKLLWRKGWGPVM
ncbi:MAG: thiamine phosphate synthase [Blautia marasmi]